MLQEAVDNYIAALTVKENGRISTNINTAMAYRNDLSQLGLYLKKQDVEDWSQVTREHLTDYLLEMHECQSYRPTTIARKLAACKSFFRYLRKEAIIEDNLVEELDSPRIAKGPSQVLTGEQISGLVQQVPRCTITGQRDFAMLHMLYATWMRASELVSLNLNDFDEEQAIVVCPGRSARTHRKRTLPLPPFVVETIAQYIVRIRPLLAKHGEEQALFLNHHGNRLTRQGFWLIIKGYAKQAGINEITPHMLRHSFEILIVKGGTELHSIQEALGYVQSDPSQLYNQMANLEICKR